MTTYSILIIDDTILGNPVKKCIDYFSRITTEQDRVNIKLVPDKETIDCDKLVNQSNYFINTQSGAVLVFINLELQHMLNNYSGEILSLTIAEEIRLSSDMPRVTILLYSLNSRKSLLGIKQFSRFIEFPGNVYFSLPIRFENHFKSWLEKATTIDYDREQEENIRKEMFSTRLQQASRQYLKDFDHSVIDKMLPLLKSDMGRIKGAKYRYWIKEKILSLFSSEISELCGIDMKKEFNKEIQQVKLILGQIESSSSINITKKIDNLQKHLINVLKNAIESPAQWRYPFNYKTEREMLINYVNKLRDIFNIIWAVDLWKLSQSQYIDIWKNMKSSIVHYYELRLKMEISLWRLSIWTCGRFRKNYIDHMFTQFLDPLIEKIEYDDYVGAGETFNWEALKNLNVARGTRLSTVFSL